MLPVAISTRLSTSYHGRKHTKRCYARRCSASRWVAVPVSNDRSMFHESPYNASAASRPAPLALYRQPARHAERKRARRLSGLVAQIRYDSTIQLGYAMFDLRRSQSRTWCTLERSEDTSSSSTRPRRRMSCSRSALLCIPTGACLTLYFVRIR